MSDKIEIFVPGRLCILGEHTDWAAQYRTEKNNLSKGITIVCSTNEGLHSTCESYSQPKICFHSIDNSENLIIFEEILDYDHLSVIAKSTSYFSYVAGTTAVMFQQCEYLYFLY